MQPLRPAEVGPFSPRPRLRRLDGRTREARFLRETEARLIAHCGGPERVSAPTRIMCERIAADLLRLEMLDQKAIDGTMTDHDSRIAHALRGSVRLALRSLNAEAVLPANSPSATDHLDREDLSKLSAEELYRRYFDLITASRNRRD